MPYKNGYYCDKCKQLFDEINEVVCEDTNWGEDKLVFLCKDCTNGLKYDHHIRIISVKRLPRIGSVYVREQ